MTLPKTIITDIDGTVFEHMHDMSKQHLGTAKVLPGVVEKFIEWDRAGYKIVLISGRRESTRVDTERQLREAGLFWDMLILGVGGGQRVLINDLKVNKTDPTAIAICVPRNIGLKDIKV